MEHMGMIVCPHSMCVRYVYLPFVYPTSRYAMLQKSEYLGFHTQNEAPENRQEIQPTSHEAQPRRERGLLMRLVDDIFLEVCWSIYGTYPWMSMGFMGLVYVYILFLFTYTYLGWLMFTGNISQAKQKKCVSYGMHVSIVMRVSRGTMHWHLTCFLDLPWAK